MSAEKKKQFRERAALMRSRLTSSDIQLKSNCLVDLVLDFLRQQEKINQVFLFAAIGNEPDLIQLVNQIATQMGRPFSCAFPVTQKTQLAFYRWSPGDPFRLGRFGIRQPEENPDQRVFPSEKTLVLVPSLMLDKKGCRLGYGGGYYDRLIDGCPHASYMGVVFSEFVVEQLPVEEHDRRVHWIASEKEIWQV